MSVGRRVVQVCSSVAEISWISRSIRLQACCHWLGERESVERRFWSVVRLAAFCSQNMVLNLSRLGWGIGLRIRGGSMVGGGRCLVRSSFGGIWREMGVWSELRVESGSLVQVYRAKVFKLI